MISPQIKNAKFGTEREFGRLQRLVADIKLWNQKKPRSKRYRCLKLFENGASGSAVARW